MKYKRILIKFSGEALAGKEGFGIDVQIIKKIAAHIKEVHDLGIELALVVGGGNMFRGLNANENGMDRATADYMGMLGTVMNALALQNMIEELGVETRVQTAIKISEIAENYVRRRAIRHLEKGRVVIFGAGTGNPYFTTDTAAALRASEIHADLVIKATKVDGLYDKDPMKFKDAVLFDELDHSEVLRRELKVMDLTAISLCKENKLPVVICNMMNKESLIKAVKGEKVGTIIR